MLSTNPFNPQSHLADEESQASGASGTAGVPTQPSASGRAHNPARRAWAALRPVPQSLSLATLPGRADRRTRLPPLRPRLRPAVAKVAGGQLEARSPPARRLGSPGRH